MTIATTPTSELEAVNEMLKAIGETPVTSLTGEIGVDVVTAKSTLATVTRAVLTEGWHFNTEHEYPLSTDLNDEIAIPANTLSCQLSRYSTADIDPVVRGLKLYDRKNHTSSFSAAIKVTIVFGLQFGELPEPARHYITYRSCREFQDDSIGGTNLHRFSESDELRARVVFANNQAEAEGLTMADTPFLTMIRRR